MVDAIGHYRIERKLGEGGMGVVYAARDERLHRDVAIKTLRGAAALGDRDRVWREARAAAAVNHPNVCHVYEVAEHGDTIYIVMELLAGEALAARIARGPLPTAEALTIGLGVLSALEALHARGIVHRDLKPANVFLTPHGVKLLDFGLAHGVSVEPFSDVRLTATGVVAGTPRYMAPEQLQGRPAIVASDLFAFGAILYEMMSGRYAFDGENVWDISHAVLHGQPLALPAGTATAAMDEVIRRCLSKRPEDRYADAAAIARDLRGIAAIDSGETPVARASRRLMVLPFRLLRPDPEIDFLSFSLADSLVVSLTGFGSLIVRSSHAAQKFAGDTLDLKRIAAEAEVDAVLTGSILRAGEQVRLVVQLVETPGGAIVWSKTAQVQMQDVFQLQDDLARQVLDSLSIPLSASDKVRLGRDVPASGQAYELYLRANHLAHATQNPARMLAARELYRACLDDDPNYAPAWARLGRVCRVLAKFGGAAYADMMRQAQEAFERAFSANPDLPLAHSLYTPFEIEQLGRAEDAMTRLLRCARHTPNDPDLFNGLVTACRYCGLLEESAAAAERVRQLDANVRTSAPYTYLLLNDEARAVAADADDNRYVRAILLLQRDRLDANEAAEINMSRETPVHAAFANGMEAVVARRYSDAADAARQIVAMGFRDPEGLLMCALFLARAGADDEAMDVVGRCIDAGFTCPQIREQPWMAPLAGHERFEQLIARAEEGRQRAAAAFRDAGGSKLLNLR